MTETMTEYADEIDAQRVAAEAYKEEATQNYKTIVDDGIKRHEDLQENWDVRLELLVNKIYVLGNSTADTEALRTEMEQKLLDERVAYEEAQRQSIEDFQRQMNNLHKLVATQQKANDLVMTSLNNAIADIRRQLADMSQQLSLYLQNQAQIVR